MVPSDGLERMLISPSPKVLEAMQNNLHLVNHYPDAQCPHLTDIISDRTCNNRECIGWVNGSEKMIKGAIDLSLFPRLGLVLPVPTFWNYKSMVAAFKASVAEVANLPDSRTHYDGNLVDNHADTKSVFLITSNNPTGRLVDQTGAKN